MKAETDKHFDLLNEAISLRTRSIQLTMGLVTPENRDHVEMDLRYDAELLGRRMAEFKMVPPAMIDNDPLLGGIVNQGYADHGEYLERQQRGSQEAWNALTPEKKADYWETFHEMCSQGIGDDHRFYKLLMNERLGGHSQSATVGNSAPAATGRNTYTATHSDEGWRVHFQPNIAPHFGMEPNRSLREVIERVENLHPEYRPRLTSSQLEDYASELNDLVDIHGYEAFVPHAVSALMRCAPPDMPPSKKIALQEDAKSAFETGVGLPHVIKQLGSQPQQKQELKQEPDRAQTL